MRRPLRGLEIKDDTYAIVRVVGSDGIPIPLFDSASETGKSTSYTSFILQSVQEARMEKHQIVDTFGEPYIFFFGEQPRFLDCSAVLVNSHDFNWEAEFWANYDTYLRGTKLVELGARVYLLYDDTVIEGYWLQAQAVKTSDQPLMIQLSFRLFVTSYSNISLVGDPDFPIRATVNLPAGVDLATADGFTVTRAAIEAAGADATQGVRDIMAAQGLAESGEGARSLTDVLRGGLASNSDITGILQSAKNQLGDFSASEFRGTPLRTKIAKNYDEFTAFLPAPPIPEDPDQDGAMEMEERALDPAELAVLAAKHGAKVDGPKAYKLLGLLPVFLQSGTTATGSWAKATFGPVADQSALNLPPTDLSDLVSFSGGVQAAGGLSGGVGVGGGVSGGFGTQGLGPAPGGRMTGAASAQGPSLGSSYAGVGVGASVVTGGVPSLFATAVVDGTLDESGRTETRTAGAWFIADETGTHSGSYAE